jgi:hypothetical protein
MITLYELTIDAWQKASTFRNPDLDEWRRAIDPVLKAAGEDVVGNDTVTRLDLDEQGLYIETSYSIRCCPMSNDMHLPLHVLTSADPLSAAQKHKSGISNATPPAAAPVQEPVIFYRCNGCGHAYERVHPTSCDCMEAGGFDRVEYYTTPPAAAAMTEFEEAVVAVDNTLHHAIDHWQDKASEQAALLRECRAALDSLIEKKPKLAMLLCGSTTLGNLKASLHDYRVKGIFDDTQPAAQPAPVQKPVEAIHIAFDYLDNGQLVATYALPVSEFVAPRLYTTPPAAARREPLTDEQITQICVDLWSGGWRETAMRNFARAIEAAHGIKEE